MKVVAICVVGVLLLTACSPADQGASKVGATTVSVSLESDAATSTTVLPKTVVEPTTSSTTPEPQGPSFLEGLDLEVVLLLNPTTGGGDLPELAWELTDGVTRYDVFVFDSEGDLYWSWSTSGSSIYLGGVETDHPNAPGPRIFPGMTWSVLGFDASGVFVAQSEVRPISP